jgi:ADP-heptose:LPS heptosyltransferase
MFTPVVRDLKAMYPDWRIGVVSAGPEIWHNNPHIDKSVTLANADEVYGIGPGKVTRGSKTNGLHITAAFRMSLIENMGRPITQGPFKPDVHLSETEKNHRIIDGKYWVINTDTKMMSAKRWRPERFGELIESMPDITFVQIGLASDNHVRLSGDNVIDMIDRTKIRELFSLAYNAEGCISLVSSLAHVAAAFDKPCIVIAGGREPPTFERYAFHRYIDTVGALKCCRLQACWHNALTACEDHDGKFARCMDMITVAQVKEAIEMYYDGGVLDRPAAQVKAVRKPILRIVANTKCLGGAERSVIQIAKMFIENKWQVELSPAGAVCGEIRSALPDEVVISNHLSRPCDRLLLYASDMVFNFDSDKFSVFDRIQADKKIMALTYKIGKAGKVTWTQGWDKYLFLSTSLRDQFLKHQPAAETAVHAPPVALEPFLKAEPDYTAPIRLVRHSSQGDVKFPADLPEIMGRCKAQFYFMPGPSWLEAAINVTKFPYVSDPKAVAAFLGKGNCFWYLLPAGYTDQGPRVIVEAMAAGLPVIAENRDGAKDRVTSETGWLLDSHAEAAELINSLTPEVLAEKGRVAQARAKREFIAERWYEEIYGE